MPKINLLEKEVAEKIAAGEVIEKPASVIKEVVENSIDAGAKSITVEIKGGGIEYMRVTDDGCGIAFDEIPTAFLRHATSKVHDSEDLYAISTMGFRGEALASVAAVARVELMTKQTDDEYGSLYRITGGEQQSHEQTGCPDGTTIIIRDLFFNTPARLKFLRKDVSEGNSVQGVVDKLALANPQVSFRFIRDNKQVRFTVGEGEYYSAIYSVFGKQFATSLIPVNFSQGRINVSGYVSSPLFTRGNRTMQYYFVNSRYICSTTVMAAVEEAFRGSIMVGKFPAAVLNITIPPDVVDVNVHPAKTEVRFADDKLIFDAVYFSVKNAIINANNSREVVIQPAGETSGKNPPLSEKLSQNNSKTEYKLRSEPELPPLENLIPPPEKEPRREFVYTPQREERTLVAHSVATEYSAEKEPLSEKDETADQPEPEMTDCFRYLGKSAFEKKAVAPIVEQVQTKLEEKNEEIRVIGEIFKTYIVCEQGDNLVLMDKHAAHERIRFNRLKKELVQTSQLLTESVFVQLSEEQFNAVSDFAEKLSDIGIEFVEQENFTLEITALPNMLAQGNAEDVIITISRVLTDSNEHTADELFDDILHSIACKGAIKANDTTSFTELEALAKQVWNDRELRFCPHGRPIITTLTKTQLEKYFSRT